VINLLCEHSLITAYARSRSVLAGTVRPWRRSLNWMSSKLLPPIPGSGGAPFTVGGSLQNLGQIMDECERAISRTRGRLVTG